MKYRIKLHDDIQSRLNALNTSLLKKMVSDKLEKEQTRAEQEIHREYEKMKMKILHQEAKKGMEMQQIIQGVMHRFKCVKRLFC